MKKRTSHAPGRWVPVLLAAVTLAACGGNDNDNDKEFTIGGTAAGLGGTVVLQNNGGDNLSVSASGAFTFATRVVEGGDYAVTVLTQPGGQTCAVTNGTGTVSSNVTSVAVTCEDNPAHTVGGTVAGLAGSVVLASNDDRLTVTEDGAFTFPTPIRQGLGYEVDIVTQPDGQTCAIANAIGNMGAADVTNVTVTCADDPPPVVTYSIGGTVSGLSGGTLQLGLTHPGNIGTSINVTANGAFSFDPDKVAAGDPYAVTVATQPAGQTCAVANGSGTAVANVANVAVTCAASTADYAVGGTITGLTGTGLRLENGAANAAVATAGATSFTLPNRLGNGASYDVGIAAQPSGQTCVITRSHGHIVSRDVSNVLVTCIANDTDPIVGTYTVPALVPGSYVYITLYADGVYIYGSLENNPGCGGTLNGNGVEYGVYNYDATTGAFTILSAVVDTNGGCGVWNGSARYTGTLGITGTGQGKTLTLTVPGAGAFDLVPVASTAGQLYGSFTDAYEKRFWLFADAGGTAVTFFNVQTQADVGDEGIGHTAGVESACGTLTSGTPANGALSLDFSPACQAPAPDVNGPVDTNGTSGLSSATSPWNFSAGGNMLNSGVFTAFRVVPN